MPDKIKKITALILMSFALLAGLLMLYRASLRTGALTIVSGKVTDKKISYFTSSTGRHYCLAFELDNRQDKIAINLGTKTEAVKDSAFYLIDTGKIYQFYMDPTVPTQNGINWGIDKVAYSGKEIYKTSGKLNLYGGAFLSLLSLAGIFIVLKYRNKKSQ